MNLNQELFRIADLHVVRIKQAIEELKPLLPFNAAKVLAITDRQVMATDFLVHRFGKLQDILGNKIINILLISLEEDTPNASMIDKINKLERLGIIDDALTWKEMREARNHAAHEYPDHPELTARYLNQLVALSPKLVQVLENIKIKMSL